MDNRIDSRTAGWLAAISMRDWSTKTMRGVPTPVISILGPALGGAFLIPHPWIGALLWLAVFQYLRHAAFALLGVAIAEGVSRALRIRDFSPVTGSLKANALLSAIAVAWMTERIDICVQGQIAILAAAAVAATVLTAAFTKALAGTNLPPLVLGYSFVVAMLFAIFPHWTHIATISMIWWPVPTDLLGWGVTFFRTLGAMLFSPTLEVGLVVAAAVLLWSRVAFACGVIGWIAGVAGATAINHAGVIYYWMPTAYNFFLAGMALGAVFFLPGRASVIMAAIGGCGASFLAAALQHLFPGTALGYLPIASALTVWIAIYALALTDDEAIVRYSHATDQPPEEAWWRAAYWARRAGQQRPLLVVPIGGHAQVSQGTDGLLSHVGPWRHALDFQCPGTLGPTTAGAGDAANWNAPVIAPAAGIVERVRNEVPDNQPGICNYAENWGNYVIIRLDQGGWALLAHFRQGSIAVQPGMRAEIGTYLGTVGNSGRSPIPHLHLQLQNSPEPGAPSLPFRLANFLSVTGAEKPLLHWHSVSLPDRGTIVALMPPNPGVHSILSSAAPGSAVWSVESDGIIPRPFRKARLAATTRIAISLDAAGRHLFKGSSGGALVSSLDPDAWRVLDLQAGAPPLLELLALAVPSIPYAAATGMDWEEPAPIVAIGMARWLGLLLSPYLAEPFVYVRCQCISAPNGQDGPLAIETNLETPWPWLPSKLTCQFDRLRGPIRLEAFFQGGTLTFSLLSFEPGLPFDGEVA